MIARAEKLGVAGRYVAFLKEIVKAAQEASDTPVDIDLLGATGAVMMDLDFSAEATWAILAISRALLLALLLVTLAYPVLRITSMRV